MEISILKRFGQLRDSDVVGRVLSGEVELFEIVIRRYNPYLYKIARSYGYHHDDAQDLMQETFVNTYFNLSQFENRSSFKTWIVRIMLNNCYQRKQKNYFKREISNGEMEQDNLKPMYSFNDTNDLDKSMANKELGHIIERAVSALAFDYRMVFSLREMNGMSTAETAEALQISESNVKVRLNRAKKMLRSEIEKMYAVEDIFEFNLVYCDPMVTRVMAEIESSSID